MKHLLLSFFCFIFIANISAQRVDTTLLESWTGVAWLNAERTITTYDAACNVATVLTQTWNPESGVWVNSTLSSSTYSGTNIITELFQLWNPGTSTWLNNSRTTYTYNASSKLTVEVHETWTGIAWQNAQRFTYTYDANGYVATSLREDWDITSSSWVNAELITNTNNSDGTVSVSVSQIWNTTTAAWVNDTRDTYTYNGDKTVSQVVSETWNTATAAWENDTRETYTYTAGRVHTFLNEVWQTNQWVNQTLFTYTYDGSNHLINALFQNWDTGTSSWVNSFQINYFYNGDNTLHQTIIQIWQINTSSWLNFSRETLSYTNACAALPLTLVNLAATRNNNVVSVNWKTEREINTSHFTVQSSLDAANFTNIGNVPAKGSSVMANNYSFSYDISSVKAGKIYYRLAMVDKDSKSVLSKVVSVTLPGRANLFTIKPNPAKSYFVIKAGAAYNLVNTVVTVSDYTGHVVIKQNVVQANEQKVNISALAKGVYTVSITTTEGVKTQKLVVD